MIGSNRKYGYLCLTVLALASAWLVRMNEQEGGERGLAPAHSPDYFSTGYTKLEMDAAGAPKSRLLAEKMTHYSDDGTTHLERPFIVFYSEPRPPWQIRSETGVLSADGKALALNGKVIVERGQAQGIRAIIINTSNLKVSPETSYAETREWAELISPPNRTSGTGMKLIFAQPIHLELLADVQGKYEKK